MEWGRDVANASIEMVAKDAARNMVEELSPGQLQNKILNYIRKRGGKNIKRREVMRSLAKSIRPIVPLISSRLMFECADLFWGEENETRFIGYPI
jgi:hypothetical protein